MIELSIQEMSIMNGNGYGSGIYINNSRSMFKNITISDNTASYQSIKELVGFIWKTQIVYYLNIARMGSKPITEL